ncbi:MAG: LytTR family DNA-binding domain-containing protein [candidate division KSB1 bacterium]
MQTTASSYPALAPDSFSTATPLHLENYLEHLPIQRMGKQLHLPVARVAWIGTQYRMVYAFTEVQRHLLDFGLDELAERLDPVQFFRIHRSAIVNLRKIAKLGNLSDGRCKLTMQDHTSSEIMVSRYRAMEFKKAFKQCARLREDDSFSC